MANKIQFEHLLKYKKEQRKMKRYINFKYDNEPTETIDEAKDLTEANYLLNEYQMSGEGRYWISNKPTKCWL